MKMKKYIIRNKKLEKYEKNAINEIIYMETIEKSENMNMFMI